MPTPNDAYWKRKHEEEKEGGETHLKECDHCRWWYPKIKKKEVKL